jgi:hypothetical protein
VFVRFSAITRTTINYLESNFRSVSAVGKAKSGSSRHPTDLWGRFDQLYAFAVTVPPGPLQILELQCTRESLIRLDHGMSCHCDPATSSSLPHTVILVTQGANKSIYCIR